MTSTMHCARTVPAPNERSRCCLSALAACQSYLMCCLICNRPCHGPVQVDTPQKMKNILDGVGAALDAQEKLQQ